MIAALPAGVGGSCRALRRVEIGGGRRRGARSARAAVAIPAGAAVWGGGGGRCQAVGSRRLGSGGARRRRRHHQADRFAPASGGPSHEGGPLAARAGLAARMERRAEPNAGGGRGRVHLSRLPRRRRTHPPGDGRREGRVATAGAAGPRAQGGRLPRSFKNDLEQVRLRLCRAPQLSPMGSTRDATQLTPPTHINPHSLLYACR